MYSVDGYTIKLSQGDTGALKVKATATLDGEPFTFGADDRALFSIKNPLGEIVFQRAFEIVNNEFTVYFLNADTDHLAPAQNYTWDVRYIIHPYYDSTGKIINGNQVLTPKEPLAMNLLTVVGDV